MRDEHIHEIPSCLRELRGEVKLTQSHLAKRLGLDSSTVSRYEKGELVPSETVVRLMLFQFGLLGCGTQNTYRTLASSYGLDPAEFFTANKTDAPIHRTSTESRPAWLDGIAENEAAVLRDFWLARRLGDAELVDEIDSHIRSIKRISKKRGVWTDEKGRKTA